MRVLAYALVLALGLVAGPARANNWGQSFDTIKQAAAQVKSVQAQFRQSKNLKILKNPLISSGSFSFQAPASIRWTYHKPIQSVLLMKDGKLSKYVKRDGAFVADSAEKVETMRVVIQEIQGWLLGRFAESKTFSPKLLPGQPSRVILKPREKSLAEFIERIELTLAPEPGVLAQVLIVENKNASTTLVFEQVELNQPLADHTFSDPK